ncbi:cyclin f-box [Cladorrhinum sp. PSN259]|nr:cyclin f-box [Cladorrhinum sp. PSN259]
MAALVPPEFRSEAEYRFREEQTDAIIRVVAYDRKIKWRFGISLEPCQHVTVHQSIATPFPRTANTGLGSLDRLPLELLHHVLLCLDMYSLFNLRQANLRSRQMVDSFKPYQAVVSHGLNLFCALLRTRLAIGVSLLDFYDALCTKTCAFCGEFGAYMSLLVWSRCCFECLQWAPETQVQRLIFVRRQFHLTEIELGQLRSFKPLTETYFLRHKLIHPSWKKETFVSVHQALLVSGQQPHSQAQARPAYLERNQTYKTVASCALPYYDRRTGTVEHGMSCAGCQLAYEKDMRGPGECMIWIFEAPSKAYAQDGFMEHFRWCEQAQVIWRSSGEVSGDHTGNPPMQPIILSMEVDDDDSLESEYRLRIGNQVKYLVISPGTFDRDTLSFPLQSLPPLPYSEEWTVATISRDKTSGDLETSISNRTLPGVKCQWHDIKVDCLVLDKTKQLTTMAFEAVSRSILPSQGTLIAKIARFEWELPRIEQETRAYQLLEGSGLAPRFLAHIHENGRIMGFLLEKIEGRSASVQDLGVCKTALGKLHKLGFVHGDVNRYNFLVTEGGVKLIDFERFQENASPESMSKELENLRAELVDESGRGGGFIFCDDSNDIEA